MSCRLPEADGQTDDRIDQATADGIGWIVGILLVAEVGDARTANADRQDAGPADIGDRIRKLAGAGGRAGGQGRQGGETEEQRQKE
jgi:hypothetical protein